MIVAAIVSVSALAVGFLAGLLTVRGAQRSCPHHGVTKTCLICETRSPGPAPQRRST